MNFADLTDEQYAVFRQIAQGQDAGHRRSVVLGLMRKRFVEPYGQGRWRVTKNLHVEWCGWLAAGYRRG